MYTELKEINNFYVHALIPGINRSGGVAKWTLNTPLKSKKSLLWNILDFFASTLKPWYKLLVFVKVRTRKLAISEKITKNENFQHRPNMTFYGLK